MSTPQWTQDQAVAFECAQEVITDLIAIKMAAIYQEEGKAQPDQAHTEALRKEVADLWRERARLGVPDQEQIATIRRVYGEQVRAYRAGAAAA